MTAVAKKSTRPSIDELRRKIGAEQNALDDLQARAVELQEQRQAALLADDDAPLAEVETAILQNLRQAERHRARLDAALAELEVAEAAERDQEARQAYEAAARQIAEAEKWQMRRYPDLAGELADGLARLKAADKLAEAMNKTLPDGLERLRPPSTARHEPGTNDRVETREVLRWVDRNGQSLGAMQFTNGEAPAGARQVLLHEEVRVPGKKPWLPEPIYSNVRLPGLHKNQSDFWWP